MTLTAADRELVRRAVDEAKRRDLARRGPKGPPEHAYATREGLQPPNPVVDEAWPVRDELVSARRRVAELEREVAGLRATVAQKNARLQQLGGRRAAEARELAKSKARRKRILLLERRLRTVQRLLDEVSQ